MSSNEITYTVTEQDLRAFYDAKGKLADVLWAATCGFCNSNLGRSKKFLDIWDDNVGSSFEFLLEGVKLRNE
tara:strand:- start:155 stop:370 length:216 start_codon:yes stop_codon:yes gene_type:complete